MSLINDVLRDLEKREQAAPAAVQAAFGTAPAAAQRPLLRWLILAGLLVLLAALLLWWLWPSASVETSQTSQTSPASPLAAAIAPGPATAIDEPPPTGQPGRQSAPEEPQIPPEVKADTPPPAAPSQFEAETVADSETAMAAAVAPPAPQATALTRPAPAPSNSAPAAGSPAPTIEIRRRDTGFSGSTPATTPATTPVTTWAPLEPVYHDLNHGRLQRAEQQLYRLLQSQPEHSQARLLLARTYLRQGRGQEAVQLLQTSTGETPQPDFDLLLAASLRETGQHTQAAALYQQLTRQYPRSLQARLGLALSEEAAGRWQAAVDSYRLLLNSPDPRRVRLAEERLQWLQQRLPQTTSAGAQPSGQPSTREGASNP